MRRLLLFDIDGTILSTDGAARRAFHRALLQVYGTAGPIAGHPFDGKTDPQITRELLREVGMTDAAIENGFPAFWPAYLRELAIELTLPEHVTRVYAGVRELLAELEGIEVVPGLLTGNLEAGAALKLGSAGIGWEQFRVGAFGSDAERRDLLPAIAVERARAGLGRDFRGDEVVILGDTPHDITCGRAIGVRAIGVATGRHSVEDLARAGAHAVVETLADTAAVVELLL